MPRKPKSTNPFVLEKGTALHPDRDPNYPSRRKVTYVIQEQIKSVASHSFSYRAVLNPQKKGPPEHVFVKTPRMTPGTGEQDRERLANIRKTYQREYLARERLAGIKNVSHYLGTGEFRLPGGEKLPFLAQSFVNGKMFDEYYQDRELRNTGNAAFAGVKSSAEWFEMAQSLVSILKRVHNQQIVHGDIGPRNVLLVDQKPAGRIEAIPFIVDFGQSILLWEQSNRPGRKEANPQVAAYRAPEIERARWWQIPADIYGIGTILFFLATGSPPPLDCKKAKNPNKLKEIIHETIREANAGLLRENEGIAKIIDKCMRQDPHDRYFCAENILADLDTFKFAHSEVESPRKQFGESSATIRATFAAVVDQNKLFADIIQKNLDMLARHSVSMRREHFEIYGDRDEIIDHLCRYLSTLRRGDEYLTVTQPSYWRKNNLGTNGRFFTMNKIMARRGVIIRRVFLVSDDDRTRAESLDILKAHQQAVEELSAEGIDVTSNTLPHPVEVVDAPTFRGSFYTGFQSMKNQRRSDYFDKEGHHVALWRKRDGTMMSIIFSTRPVEHERSHERMEKRARSYASAGTHDAQIVKVRFWASKRLERDYNDLKKISAESKPLHEFLRRSRGEKVRPRTTSR
jgi:serine/threonine protein kinase